MCIEDEQKTSTDHSAVKKILYWVIPISKGSIFLRKCRKLVLVGMAFHVVEVVMSFFSGLVLLLVIE